MAAIYHAQVVQIIPHYSIRSGNDAVNVTYWLGTGNPYSQVALDDIRANFDQAWQSHWSTVAPSVNTYKGAVVTDVSSAFGLESSNETFVAIPGASGANSIADQVAALISLHVAERYKGGHGRIYVPGLAGNMLQDDGSTIQSVARTALLAMWTDTVTAMGAISAANGGPLKPIVWHKKWAAHPNTTADILSVTVQPISATQRRRIRKVSRHKKKVV